MAIEKILLGGGCFWCIEAVYREVKGVISSISGYAGGDNPNPTYQQICTGTTNHAEVVEVTFDNEIVNLDTILDVFWTIHDPTTLNAQGADRGTQYRSVVYYYEELQKERTIVSAKEIQKSLRDPIVTELATAPTFYSAEDYHQNYYNLNSSAGYCQMVISPKVAKFRAKFL
jgi:peptide-methionine (S)-S-oxide reductase